MPASVAPPRRRKAGNLAFQEPLMAGPEKDRPQDHNGIPVVREQLRMSPLPSCKAPLKISRLHLANKVVAFACRDCLYTGDTLADVMHHRNAEHGAKYGKKKPKVEFPADDDPTDIILPPRAAGLPAPGDIMEMTMAELLSLLPSLHALGALIQQTEAENEALTAEIDARRHFDLANQDKLAAYDSLQAELVDRRLTMKGSGSYEEMKAELTELRAWKKQIIKRFSAIGFMFTEEEK